MRRSMRMALFGFVATGVLAGQQVGAADSAKETPEILSFDCESSLALAAAPPHLKDGAGLYVLEAGGFRQATESENGYVCIVNRIDNYALRPTCFDAEGARTIVPKILFFGERLMEGIEPGEIAQEVVARFESDEFQSPARAGVAYMLSHYNRPYNAGAGSLGWFPPHIMFYAPDVTNDDIATNWPAVQANPMLPFVAYQGPQGYFVVRTGEENDPAANPKPACPAWVSANPPK